MQTFVLVIICNELTSVAEHYTEVTILLTLETSLPQLCMGRRISKLTRGKVKSAENDSNHRQHSGNVTKWASLIRHIRLTNPDKERLAFSKGSWFNDTKQLIWRVLVKFQPSWNVCRLTDESLSLWTHLNKVISVICWLIADKR